jgi:hypothetical protein
MTAKYLVRQYRPAYFTGFDVQVMRDVPYDGITEVPWCENFKHHRYYGANATSPTAVASYLSKNLREADV